MSQPVGPVVVKVGGSLYDLPDLGPRLRAWLTSLDCPHVLIVPGGGPAAEVIRDHDRRHGLGEAVAHELALRALSLNAWFLMALLGREPQSHKRQEEGPGQFIAGAVSARSTRVSLVDAYAFWRFDSARNPGRLPACWDATSDSVAARVACVTEAAGLVLLKSVSIPQSCDWAEAAHRGWVDPVFPTVLPAGLPIRAINLREWR